MPSLKINVGLIALLLFAIGLVSREVHGQDEAVEKETPTQVESKPDQTKKQKPKPELKQPPKAPVDPNGEDVVAVKQLSLDEIRSLIFLMGSDVYSERAVAHERLFDQGEPLLQKLEKLKPFIKQHSSDPEITWRVAAIRHSLTRSPFENSIWSIELTEDRADLNLNPKTLLFLEDGTFSYVKGEGNHTHAKNSDWRSADRDTITFSFNNSYATYKGKRISASVVEGVANNIKGKSWLWRMTLQE